VVRIHPPQPTFIMTNYIAQTQSKHGTFIHFRNDDPIGACLHYYGEWAQQELNFFDLFLTENSNVIDVGANIGTHSVYFSKKCNKGNVIAIEPQMYIFEILSSNLLINGCFNTIPIHAGAASSESDVRIVNTNPFGNEKVNYGEFKVSTEPDKGVPTRLIKLDRFIDLAKFDLIKLDVEGLELDVLEGSKKLLKKHKPFLYIEFNNKKGNDDLLKKIYQLGYIPYWHVYTKHNPDNHNKQTKNIWEPDNYIIDENNLDLRYEGNAFCAHKDGIQPTGLEKIEVGSNITKWLFENNHL
jgi:FkbM family methyltransferase